MAHTPGLVLARPGEPDQLILTGKTLPAPGPTGSSRQPGSSPSIGGLETHRDRVIPTGSQAMCLASMAWAPWWRWGPMSPTCAPAPGSPIHTDLRHGGGFARHTWCRLAPLMPVPDALSDETGRRAPLPRPHRLAGLAKLPHLRGGLLITGLAAVSAASRVQLALQKGARVFSASPRRHQWLKQLGVQGVADYRDPDRLAQLQAANGGEPF